MLDIYESIESMHWWREPMTYVVMLLGMTIGSFLNVCILRIPEKTFLKNMRSVCPGCQKQIPFYLNIPIFSWILLRGKAKCCQMPIAKMYPLVESLTAIMFIIVYWHDPFIKTSQYGFFWDPAEFIRCLHMLIFTALMIVVSVIDLRHQIIPDVISLPMIGASLIWILVHPQLDWFSSLMGIALGGGILWAVAWIYFLIRRDYGLGFGDVKLLAAIGGWLGVQAVLPSLFFGSVLGAIIGVGLMVFSKDKGLKTKIPFGPFLAFGAWLHMLVGSEVMTLFLIK